MGKAYVLSSHSENRVLSMAREFANIVHLYPYRRKVHMSQPYQRRNDENWRIIVDVCGIPSAEIDSIHAAIQEWERM